MKKNLTLLLILCTCIFLFTGCSDKEEYSYASADIVMEHTSNSGVARINITDQYTKAGKKYYIFTTDKTNEIYFILSEEEYDKYIGMGNDAVDYTAYTLNFDAPIVKYSYLFIPKNGLPVFHGSYGTALSSSDLKALITQMDATKYTFDESYNIIFDPGMSKYDSFYIYASEYEHNKCKIGSHLEMQRFSFLGQNDFTEDDINNYYEIMNQTNLDFLSILKKENIFN